MKSEVVIKQLIENQQLLHVISPQDQTSLEDFLNYLDEDEEMLRSLLLKHGAILFRGFDVNSNEDFKQVKDRFFGTDNFSYMDGNSPRTKLSSNIYTSTEYPNEYAITLHNELSYSSHWPQYLLFYCHIPSEDGGETPLCDCRQILQKLDKDIVKSFDSQGVKYTRFLSGANGVGKSWMATFETTDRLVIEKYCLDNKIEFFWENDDLYLSHLGRGIIRHPVTNEEVWFNQANQFHPSSLPEDVARGLELFFADTKYKYPQYAYYGDGTEIPEAYLKEITSAHFENAFPCKWEKGDVLFLDNLIMAHGRMPFKGERKVYVSMC